MKQIVKCIGKGLLTLVFILGLCTFVQLNADAAVAAPEGLQQTNATTNSVTVEWDTVFGGDTMFYYYYSISESPDFDDAPSNRIGSNSTTPSQKITGLGTGKTYYVRIGTATVERTTEEVDGSELDKLTDSEIGKLLDKYMEDSTISVPGMTISPIAWSEPLAVVTQPDDVNADSILQTDASATGATLKWDSVRGASGYKIVYYLAGSKEQDGTSIEVETNSVTLMTLQKNSEYNVRIYTYSQTAGYKTNYGSGKLFYYLKTLPTKVTNLSCTTFYPYVNSAYFSFEKCANADGYEYRVYNNANKQILKGSTTSSRTLQLSSGKLSGKKFYRIKIRAYINISDNVVKKGAWSDVLYFARAPFKGVDAKRTGNGICVTWPKIAGTTNYTVSVSTSEKSGYKKIGTTDKTSFTFKTFNGKSLKKGTKYYIRLTANKKVGKVTYKSTQYYYCAGYLSY